MQKKKKTRREPDSVHLGFQIAPMIDVVFVIMLFFMVMAGLVVNEKFLNLKLPGMAVEGAVDAVEETQVRVSDVGEVILNEEVVGDPGDTKLQQFTYTMINLAKNAEASQSKVVVTIVADELAAYQRVIDVLNALSVARIQNVTFEVPPQ